MSDYASIISKIKTLLEGVTGIGKVYDKPLDLRTYEDLKNYATIYDGALGKNIINCWIIERASARDIRGGAGVGFALQEAEREEIYRISGVYAYYDSGDSVVPFQGLVDRILQKFLPEITFDDPDTIAGPLVARSIGFRTFGEVVCHSVALELPIRYRQTGLTYV